MSEWHKTGCVLCAQNCGLEVLVEEGRMTTVRPDKENRRSEGYACRKGLNVINHQYPKDRLTEPLKRVGDDFEPISWDRAIDEIAGKLAELRDRHGSRSLAYMGGGGQGGHFEAAFGLRLLRGLGSSYYYSATGQEFSGHWWVTGRVLGKQYNIAVPDEHNSEMMVAWGWNGMMSHQIPQARKILKEFSRDPDRLLVVIDPRKSETAAIANIHLAIRPSTDALLMKAMLAIILEEGWEDREYLDKHVAGWDKVRPWFEGFDVKAALEVCQLDHERVRELCRLMHTRRWCVHPDLGIYMSRNSTLNSYLMHILGAACGIFCVSGGNVIPPMLMPMGFHADERNPKIWRTLATGMPPAAAGSFPPNVMPEEIMNDHPERLRGVIVSASNPLRSYADTTAYEEAFRSLDLLVVNEIAMTETARLAHYVLPCRTYYECWDGTFFPMTYPGLYFQMRRPVVDPPEQCLEAGQIYVRLAEKLGLIPDIPDDLRQAAFGDRLSFGMKLMEWAGTGAQSLGRHALCAGPNPGPGLGQRQFGRALGPAHDRSQGFCQECRPGRVRGRSHTGGQHFPGHSGQPSGALGGPGRCGRLFRLRGHRVRKAGDIHSRDGRAGRESGRRFRKPGPGTFGRVSNDPQCRTPHGLQRQHLDAEPGLEQGQTGLHCGHEPPGRHGNGPQ